MNADNPRPVFSNTNRNPFNSGAGTEPPRVAPQHETPAPKRSVKSRISKENLMNYRAASVTLFVGIVIIVVSILLYLAFGQRQLEGNYVNKSDYQSVFVNVTGTTGGQAYFGKIVSINSSYVVLDNVFYLENGQSADQFTLNKLNCALYDPIDQMVINRDQVDFWENLSASSEVTQDINKWNTDNLACASNNTSSATSGTTTPATTPTPSTTATPTPSPSTSPTPSPSPSTTP